MFFEAFVNELKFSCFLPQFSLNVARSKDVLKINPVFLHDQPIVDDQHGIVDCLLDLFSLCSLSFEVSITEDCTKVSQ